MAMPEGLKWLGKTLVSFIAYSQGLDRRCNQPPPRHWNHTSLESFSFLSRCRPRPSWDAAEPIDALDDEEEWAWQCPWEAWVSRLDHHKAPWWSWHQIERFWVDANFLYGSFPATLAEAWPKMRSLDLQLNELSGPLPAALSKLPKPHSLASSSQQLLRAGRSSPFLRHPVCNIPILKGTPG